VLTHCHWITIRGILRTECKWAGKGSNRIASTVMYLG